jgi:hypothetical protein
MMPMLILILLGIAMLNVLIGLRWSRLDHNPWTGRFFGGTFSTPNPGWNPGAMSVDTINRRGRRLMVTAPIAALIFLIVVLVTRSPS